MTEIHPGLVALGHALFDTYHADDDAKPEPWDIHPKRKTWIKIAARVATSGSEAQHMADLERIRQQ